VELCPTSILYHWLSFVEHSIGSVVFMSTLLNMISVNYHSLPCIRRVLGPDRWWSAGVLGLIFEIMCAQASLSGTGRQYKLIGPGLCGSAGFLPNFL
jgi:hypothetical protein